MNSPQPRKPEGTPDGGQFAHKALSHAQVSLGGGGGTLVPEIPEEERPAYDPSVSLERLQEMLRHDQPLGVRAAAARTPYPGVAETASHDPSPVIRALALEAHDLSPDARERLTSDRAVTYFLSVITEE